MSGLTRSAFSASAILALAAVACGPSSEGRIAKDAKAVAVGREPATCVHLVENHSSSLVAWRRAGVRDRIVVHVDGHSDFDWLPDETVARIAAAKIAELPEIELGPYAMDGSTLRRFGIWNFLYPAARVGIAREIVWVVPDGTLGSPAAASALVRDLVLDKLHMVSLDEARGLHLEGRAIKGRLIGVPFTICELADLEVPKEAVLLDVDLDYFTTRSATSQEVVATPWIEPGAFVEILARKGLRADVVTLSLSTMGGYLPPANRWIGARLQAILRDPSGGKDPNDDLRREAVSRAANGHPREAEALYRRLTAGRPDDASGWYALARVLESTGRVKDAEATWAKAIAIDPMFEHADLFEADRLWLNGAWGEALDRYRRYRAARPASPFGVYALRREAGCLMRLNRNDEAIAAYRAVTEVAPDHPDSRLDLGVLLREKGLFDDAVAQMQHARALLPELGTYAMALGTTYVHMGRMPEGVAELETAVARRPTWAQAQAALAAALADTGHLEDAAMHLNAAIALSPRDPQYRRLQTWLHRRGITTTEVSAHP